MLPDAVVRVSIGRARAGLSVCDSFGVASGANKGLAGKFPGGGSANRQFGWRSWRFAKKRLVSVAFSICSPFWNQWDTRGGPLVFRNPPSPTGEGSSLRTCKIAVS
jgi:hypothetical protein